jgi:hypothetical protein
MNKPIESFSVGGLNLALWENEGEEGRTYKTVSLRKSFFNRSENKLDQQSLTLDPTEVSCLASLLCRMANAVITSRTTE